MICGGKSNQIILYTCVNCQKRPKINQLEKEKDKLFFSFSFKFK